MFVLPYAAIEQGHCRCVYLYRVSYLGVEPNSKSYTRFVLESDTVILWRYATRQTFSRRIRAARIQRVRIYASLLKGNFMTTILKHSKQVLFHVTCAVLLATVGYASSPTQQFVSGKKAKVTGAIVSRNGDLISIKVKKEGTSAVINITDDTKFDRERAFRLRPASMDVTAMVPGLTITAEGVGNAKGQLDADKIKFDPNEFAIEIAQEQQIQANKSSAGAAQSTANQGVSAADNAQSSANQAQTSADAAGQVAVAAGAGALMNANSIALVNQRVSNLGDYKTVIEAALFFDSGKSDLSADDKKVLDKLASDAASTQNYMIEVAGYTSSTGTETFNQKLSDERASAVTQYLRNTANVPMRRILAPAGYGETHAAATNTDTQGRDINRRVDVKVLVNKGLDQGI